MVLSSRGLGAASEEQGIGLLRPNRHEPFCAHVAAVQLVKCHACIGVDSCQACAQAEVPAGLQDDSNSADGSWGPQFLAAHKLGYKLAGGSSCCQAEQADEAAAAGCLVAACLSSLSSTCTFTATAVVPGARSCKPACSWNPESAN